MPPCCSKLLYLKTELLADLGFKNWRSTEFWVTVVIFTFMFWLRMYLHYLGQYLYLWVRTHTHPTHPPTSIAAGLQQPPTTDGPH